MRRFTHGLLVASLVLGLSGVSTAVFATPITTGLQAWYRADVGVTTISGDVSQWSDSSGNGNHATQGTAGARPLYTTAVMPNTTSMPIVAYGSTGGFDQLVMAGVQQDGGTGSTVYFIINNDADASNGINKNWMNRSAGPAIYGNPNGAGASATGYFDNSWGGDFWYAEASGVTGWKLVRSSWVPGGTGNYQTYMTDFVISNTANEVASGPLTTGNWNAIGFPGFGQQTFSSFAEILIYNRSLTGVERTSVENYLYGKYFAPIPEPSSLALLAFGMISMWLFRKKKV